MSYTTNIAMNTILDTLAHSTDYLDYGVIIADNQYKITRINNKAKQLLGITGEPTDLHEIDGVLPQHTQFMEHVIHCGPNRLTCNFGDLDVHESHLAVYLSPIFDEHSKLLGRLLSIHDKSDDQSAKLIPALVHELRTPLTAVRGNASILQEDFGQLFADEQPRQLIGFVRSGSEDVLTMVNDILEMARLEDGRATFDLQALPIGALITETVNPLMVLAEQRGLALAVQQSELLRYPVVGDPARIRQVLTNLISNAIKFTQTGGVTISLAANQTSIEVSVTDSGAGIPPEEQASLFGKFFQTSNNPLKNDSSKSTGLGLYICKLIMHGMGGDIYLKQSVLGQGSTFSFTLDIATPERQAVMQQQLTDQAQGVKHTRLPELTPSADTPRKKWPWSQ